MLNKNMISRRILSISAILLLTSNISPIFASEVAERSALRAMWDDHQVEVNRMEPMALDPGYTGIGKSGDILIALDSITDHVGIVMDKYTVIEAHPKNANKGVDYRDNNWKSRYSRIKGLEVSGANNTKRSNAVQYAKRQINEPYKLMADRWNETEWYCSKLVWRAWYEQGYDIEGRKGEPRGTHVTPGDILNSPLTNVFYTT